MEPEINAAPTNPPIPFPANCKPETAPTIPPRLAGVQISPATPELIANTGAMPAA